MAFTSKSALESCIRSSTCDTVAIIELNDLAIGVYLKAPRRHLLKIT